MEKGPLVSICITFYNAEKFIERILGSSLNQTYKNIEIVALDDMSSDKTQEIIKKYTESDSRIKYSRNTERIGTLRSLVKTVELSRGEFIYWPGVDDWLSRDFVERGVRHFKEHPEIAAVAPNIISLEGKNGKFSYLNETIFRPGIYSAEWFVRRRYKDGKLLFGQFVFLRREDMLNVLEYFIKTYCEDPALPKEFREFSERIFGIDTISFVKILSRYKNFAIDPQMGFIKIMHPGNVTFNFKFDSAADFLRFNYYNLLYYEPVYGSEWPRFASGMRVYWGADNLATLFLEWLKRGFKPSFWKGYRNYYELFFSYFSLAEKTAAFLLAIPRVINRILNFAFRGLNWDNKEERERAVFTKENFLNQNGKFEA
jgi:glycosyltransferase involved in cell wall biosynthesis